MDLKSCKFHIIHPQTNMTAVCLFFLSVARTRQTKHRKAEAGVFSWWADVFMGWRLFKLGLFSPEKFPCVSDLNRRQDLWKEGRLV